PGMEAQKKVIGSLAIVILGAGYAVVLSMAGLLPDIFVKNPDLEAHYTELEQHRARQRQSSPESADIPASEAQTVEQPVANSNTSAEAPTIPPPPKVWRNYWTDYRGPNRDGRYDELRVLATWPASGPPELWRQPVGGGYASFVVAEGVAYTIEQRREKEVVAAYDVETGREIWTHGWNASFVESMGGDGPRATPTWNEGRIYALGATGEFRCLDARTGKAIWGRNILTDNRAQNLEWGMAASPLVVDDKVIVLPGGSPGRSVVAYNRLTGEPVWRSLDDRQAYVSPMLVRLAGQRQIVVVTSRRVVGLTVEKGALLWEYPWETSMGINCSQPIAISENRLFISSGYGKGAAVIEIIKDGNGYSAKTVWENTNMKNKFNSSVYHEGYIYGLDEGILCCVDAATGERKWKGGRYGYGQVLLAGSNLVVISDAGDLALVKAAPDQHTELVRFAALEGKTWNYPAIAGGRLLVRNTMTMACYNISAN
ncbi:MAG TPA: PQQ-binding-like beta-propeller repeat protein, partial [Blastocatellia bacterium]|nr:PQQ-binding-like beta-propeller repeat protein [Blastocatellia bacterium]